MTLDELSKLRIDTSQPHYLAIEIPVLVPKTAPGRDELPQGPHSDSGRRREPRDQKDILQPSSQLGVLDRGVEQSVLRFELVVDGRPRHTRPLRDVVDACSVETRLGEQVADSGEDFLPDPGQVLLSLPDLLRSRRNFFALPSACSVSAVVFKQYV